MARHLLIAIKWAVRYLIRNIPRQREYLNVTIPNQLVDLVRQAQAGQSFETEWHISVGADMRPKLCYPLTPEQVELIKATPHDQCQAKEFSCRLAEYKFTDNELSGIVLASVRFQDDSRKINLDYKDVPVRVRCTGRPSQGWWLSSVEYL